MQLSNIHDTIAVIPIITQHYYLMENIWRSTCIHVSSIWGSGDVSGEEIAGGNGWISLGTTTRSLPKTNIAPALFAVPIGASSAKT